MRSLVDYVDILETMPELGKNMKYVIANYEIRHLIYKKHRIIYHIKENNIVILSVLHTRLDLGKTLRKLKRDIQ